MNYKETTAKSILVPSKLPDADYVVNPYTGCEFGCSYCYASFMGKYVNETIANWGNYVYVKSNAVELARQELAKWPADRLQSSVLLSSVTDPYQGAEKKFELTRGILQAFVDAEYPGPVGILTKSPLVLRDVDILRQIHDLEVGLTVTTTDDQISRELEVRAPLASRRLDTLAELNKAGIPTYAFVGPLLPHFRARPELLRELFGALASAGVKSLYVEHMNISKYIRDRLVQITPLEYPEAHKVYTASDLEAHRDALSDQVHELVREFGFTLLHETVLTHKKGSGAEPQGAAKTSK
jgi:DNA repair photolyase